MDLSSDAHVDVKMSSAKSASTPKAKIGRQDEGENAGKTSTICVLCNEVIWHLKNATSNYSRHLQRRHPADFQQWTANTSKHKTSDNKMHQSTLNASLSPISQTAKYGLGHPRQIELCKMIFNNLIIGLDLPLSITEKSAFIQVIAIVDPKFRIPSRRAITTDYLSKAYDQIMMKLKKTCSLVEYVVLTFDAWSDRRIRSFYGVIVHYVNQTGEIKAHLLAFNPLSDDVEETDDDADETNVNMSKGHCPNDENILNEFEKGEELLRLPCFIHTLQLDVKDGLAETTCARSAVTKVAKITKLSRTSVSVAEKLQEVNHTIPLAVITRWNSQCTTISRILDIPNLHVLREFISIFTSFAEATTKTQAEQSISISLVVLSVLGIYFDLENESKVCKYSGSLCTMLIYSLKRRFGGLLLSLEVPVDDSIKRRSTFYLFSDDIFLICSFLAGKFRLRSILKLALPEETKNRLCEKIKRLVVQAAIQVCHSMNNELGDNAPQVESMSIGSDNRQSDGKDSTIDSPTTERKSLFSYFEATSVPQTKKRIDIIQEINEEIMVILEGPHLHQLALRIPCVPATSAPSERIFSKSSILMRLHRSRLSKDILAKLTLVKCNLDLFH
ncbi:unnamed protein product [Adineta ricciae]|uniref:HAT C-terminal dimerisation domain-containing protein n=1 Tax=Adineta ricciae TaxID=249248 RepID=A0A815N6Q8_ADIRI|nr:unnamed protein product [Adineta ricciae]